MNYGDYYYCEHCKNVVRVMYAKAPALVCCGDKMILLEGKTSDVGVEKHLPVIEEKGDMSLVKVGDVPHPMTPEHQIVSIEVLGKDGISLIAELSPNQKPEVLFNIKADDIAEVKSYCNIHGLWIK